MGQPVAGGMAAPMPDTFADHRKDVWYDVQLQEGMPGVETVTYRKPGGEDKTVVVKRVEDESDREAMELHEAAKELFKFRCGRDVEHEKGGIVTPEIRDLVIREDGSRYSYTGEKENITPHAWTLLFRRATPDVAGRIQP
jgi:hypothetical protein